jgi:hypothetical protein
VIGQAVEDLGRRQAISFELFPEFGRRFHRQPRDHWSAARRVVHGRAYWHYARFEMKVP